MSKTKKKVDHNNEKFTPEQVIEALEQSAGIYLGASGMLNCSSTTIANYVGRYPKVAEAKERISEEILDIAETNLVKGIQDGSEKYTMFILGTRGKSRGYSRRTELTGEGGGPLRTKEEKEPDLSNLTDKELDEYERLVSKTEGDQEGAPEA